jgi:ATP-dependent Clp protease ATP-binding subunit ClpA
VEHAVFERRAAQLAARPLSPPSPGPIPPVFERFTSQTRDAINAGIENARKLDDRWVEPAHLLFGVLDTEPGVAATVRSRFGWQRPPAQLAQPPAYSPRATGIFTPEARHIVAEDALIIAERLGYRALTSGHVLLAILERYAYLTIEFISSLPDRREITEAVIDALPGAES